jgi:hypothetical protein
MVLHGSLYWDMVYSSINAIMRAYLILQFGLAIIEKTVVSLYIIHLSTLIFVGVMDYYIYLIPSVLPLGMPHFMNNLNSSLKVRLILEQSSR